MARNKAVKNSAGGLVVFIDDDEYPQEDWLVNLFKTYQNHDCSGVAGPVSYVFQGSPPEWLKKVLFFQRRVNKTGTVLKDGRISTSNVLLNKALFNSGKNYFNPAFGKTGGGDIDFFLKLADQGDKFIWCDSALVQAIVPLERQKISWLLMRYLRYGGVYFKLKVEKRNFCYKLLFLAKNICLSILYWGVSPFLIISGKHNFVDYLLKLFYRLGIIFAAFGYVRVEYK